MCTLSCLSIAYKENIFSLQHLINKGEADIFFHACASWHRALQMTLLGIGKVSFVWLWASIMVPCWQAIYSCCQSPCFPISLSPGYRDRKLCWFCLRATWRRILPLLEWKRNSWLDLGGMEGNFNYCPDPHGVLEMVWTLTLLLSHLNILGLTNIAFIP